MRFEYIENLTVIETDQTINWFYLELILDWILFLVESKHEVKSVFQYELLICNKNFHNSKIVIFENFRAWFLINLSQYFKILWLFRISARYISNTQWSALSYLKQENPFSSQQNNRPISCFYDITRRPQTTDKKWIIFMQLVSIISFIVRYPIFIIFLLWAKSGLDSKFLVWSVASLCLLYYECLSSLLLLKIKSKNVLPKIDSPTVNLKLKLLNKLFIQNSKVL